MQHLLVQTPYSTKPERHSIKDGVDIDTYLNSFYGKSGWRKYKVVNKTEEEMETEDDLIPENLDFL
jgi:hypothetical protein